MSHAQLDPKHAGSLVDIGPDPNAPQAAEFRAFWGDKAELRRFQVSEHSMACVAQQPADTGQSWSSVTICFFHPDSLNAATCSSGSEQLKAFSLPADCLTNALIPQDGRILEAVAWQLSPAERHLIPDHVLQYALTRHLGGDGVRVRGCAGLLDRALAPAELPLERQLAAQRWGQRSPLPTWVSKQFSWLDFIQFEKWKLQAFLHAVQQGQLQSAPEHVESLHLYCPQLVNAARLWPAVTYVLCWGHRQLQEATDLIAKQLRSLSLALVITAVQPMSAVSRRVAAFPVEAHLLAGASALASAHLQKVPRCLQPVELLVQLEGSGEAMVYWNMTSCAYSI